MKIRCFLCIKEVKEMKTLWTFDYVRECSRRVYIALFLSMWPLFVTNDNPAPNIMLFEL